MLILVLEMRVASGVHGFDELVGGGIPEKSLVLLTGGVGTGKTIFCLQFLCTSKEPGVFMSFEEEPEQLKQAAKDFGWDAAKLEREKKLKFIKFDPYRLEDIMEVIENSVREVRAKRVVIDSISTLGVYIRDVSELRRLVVQMSAVIKKSGCTALITSEMPSRSSMSRFGVEEFVADGVVVMERILTGSEYRDTMSVHKMRMTGHSKTLHHYEITKKGIVVKA
jgi:KaiC/GvpD/RAD55 family RecA-like ATPase